jgi:hypothetical protein
METFSALREFVDNPRYHQQRQVALKSLDLSSIDPPIVEIVGGFAKLPYCFTLQSCYGHFLYTRQTNPLNIEPLPLTEGIRSVEYRIAYLALCIEDTKPGRVLLDELREVPSIDPEYVQFGCAEWFWERQVNSYALQVEPNRHRTKDSVRVNYQEALHIEQIRNQFFAQIKKIVQKRL